MELPNGFASHIESMMRSPLRNYIVPGLSSYLLGGEDKGCVRVFSSKRNQQSDISPHSHRFDFVCLVLRGTVRNIIWKPSFDVVHAAEHFAVSNIEYEGEAGHYKKKIVDRSYWEPRESAYQEGDFYGMSASQVHSIFFSKDALVLFFEGPAKTNKSIVLDPVVNDEVIPTSDVQPWMFRKQPLDDHFA